MNRQDKDLAPARPAFWEQVVSPGLTGVSLAGHRQSIPKRLAVLEQMTEKPFAWVVLLGGTGTGKSTVFNLLSRAEISRTGVERPMTSGPVMTVPAGVDPGPWLPWFLPPAERLSPGASSSGRQDRIQILAHDNQQFSHLAFVDTPDLDSLEEHNQDMAENMALLADAVIFVLSQEKYADQVLVEALSRVHGSGKPVLALLNRVHVNEQDQQELAEDVLQTLDPDRAWLHAQDLQLLPFFRSKPQQGPREEHALFRAAAGLVSRDDLAGFLRAQAQTQWQRLRLDIKEVVGVLRAEDRAAEDWKTRLDSLLDQSREQLLRKAEQAFEHTSRANIQAEIRKLFSRYDLLAGPRRLVSKTVLAPIRLLGLSRAKSRRSRHEALKHARHKAAWTPVLEALNLFQQRTLETLSPADRTSPVFHDLRREGTLLGQEEAREMVEQRQAELAGWLESRFEALAENVPRSRVFGMYTTSVLWGVLLLSFETAIGGGITLIEALINSAVAPFLTKGAVELFAYREVQAITRELARRSEQGLFSVLTEQRDRFAACVDRHLAPAEAVQELESLSARKRFEA